MDSPFKRRKTSPTTSIKVSDLNTQLQYNTQDGERSPCRRASFMSPTRASLARFNPELLPPTKPATPGRRGSSGSQRAYRQSLSRVRLSNGDAFLRAKSTEPSAGAAVLTADAGLRKGDPSAITRPRSRTPEGEPQPLKRDRSVVVGDIRASPPDEAKEESHVSRDIEITGNGSLESNEFDEQLRRTDTAGIMLAIDQPQIPSTPSRLHCEGLPLGMSLQEDGEPSLPSTPVQLGLEKPPEPPKGLLFSSPSRRSKRNGIVHAKSSPLKPQPEDPVQPSLRSYSSNSSLGPRLYIAHTPKPAPNRHETQLFSMRQRLASLEETLREIEGCLIRKLLVSGCEDNESRGTKNVSKPEKEMLARCEKVIRLREEIHQLEVAGVMASDLEGTHTHDQGDVHRQRIGNTTTIFSPLPPNAIALPQRLAQFLPFFSRAPPSTPKPPSPQGQGHSQVLVLEPSEDGVAPFTFMISDPVLLTPTSDDALLQSQIIVLSSPSRALYLKFSLTVNVVSQIITEMQIIEFSEWAEGELGTWLRASSQERSIATIGIAVGSYWRVCLQRLRSWDDAVRDYGDIIANDSAFGKVPLPPNTADLLFVIPHLCWRELHMIRGSVALVIEWRISFKDDGKVESDVSALATFPESWGQTETGSELNKIGEAFKMLVGARGVAQAICVLAGLLFPG